MPAVPTPSERKHKWDLKAETMRLRAAGGEQYENFVKAFEAYYHDVTEAVTDTPADQVLGAQGQARATKKLLLMFQDVMK